MAHANQDEPTLVAGRYRVESKLGRGAMGEVLLVRDQASGERLALKRLTRPSSDRVAAALFEREYHALASLRHPCIIQVFDYGLSEHGPYYTMELLEGGDLRELAPLPYPEACRYVRDVASALSLLHARRLLHRDISARNVRVTSDGRCKLIDFGALATFGVHGEIVGAPPCVPPEALRGLPLDQRADLYALGTLLYYVLTGRHAYPVRRIEDLEDELRKPLALPSQLLAERVKKGETVLALPQALEAFLMSMLSLDPLSRPGTAADVAEELTLIGKLDAQPQLEPGVFLSAGRLVGRDHELQRIRDAVAEAKEYRGGGMLVLGQPGTGKSRLLHEIALQAQLAGMVVARADATQHGGAYGVVRELVERLLDALPQEALQAARAHGEILTRFSPRLRERLGISPIANPMAGTPGEWRKRTQLALREWFLALAARRRIALIVDDLEAADDASCALLARLGREGRVLGMLVCVSFGPEALANGQAPLRAFENGADVLRPAALDEAQTLELLRTLFGDVPNIQRLAHFAFERSQGLPARIVGLSEALVAARVVRALVGSWVIPEQLTGAGLDVDNPPAIHEARLSQLSHGGRSLADLLSLRRAPLPVHLWTSLARSDGQPSIFATLDELVAAGMVLGSGAGMRFAQESLRAHIEARLPHDRAARLHRELGRLLLEQPGQSGQLGNDVNQRMEAGFHLLRGGDETRGADLLAEAGLEMVYDGDEMPAAGPALEAALAIYRKQGRSVRELCRLLGPLSVAGYHTDLRLAETYGEEAIVLQERLLGLRLAARLRGFLGKRLSLYLGLGFGLLGFVLSVGRKGVAGFIEAVTLFVTSSTALCGAATICLDRERARRYANAIEPLSLLGENHVGGLAYRFAYGLTLITEDRQAECTRVLGPLVEVLERGQVRQLTPAARLLLLGGVRYALGAIEGFREGTTALRYADALEGMGSRLYDMVADQVRTNYYANRGESALAEEHRKRVELHAIDTGSGWQAEVWSPSAMINVAALTKDVIALRRAAEQLEHLSARIPSLALYAHLARSTYRCLRGDPGVVDEYERWVRALPPRSFNGWAPAVGMIAHWRIVEGDYVRAREVSGFALSQLTPEDRQFTALTLKVEVLHALALAGLGEVQAALAELNALHERVRAQAGPLSLGFLHEHLARVHALAGDRPAVEHHAEEMTRWYRVTGNPVLFTLAERARSDLALPRLQRDLPAAAVLELDDARRMRNAFRECHDADARAQRVLDVLMHQTGAESGFLFSVDQEQPRLIAPLFGDEPSDELLDWLRSHLGRWTPEDADTTSGLARDTSSFSKVRLCVLERGHPARPVAAAVLDTAGRRFRWPPPDMRSQLADSLDGAAGAFTATATALSARR